MYMTSTGSPDISPAAVSPAEIVVPIFRNEEVIAVLDIDSRKLNAFDEIDREGLERILGLIQFDKQ